MPKDKNLIRVGDRVKIVNPEVVMRWGYPLSKKIVRDTMITKEQKDALITMMRVFNGSTPTPIVQELPHDLFDMQDDEVPMNIDYDTYDKILNELAHKILKDKGYGGNERKLYTTMKESLRDKVGCVHERIVVKTGTHVGGGGSYSYNGDFDYEPPYLDNEKTHVLFKFIPNYNYRDGICQEINTFGAWIEKKNFEKII